MSSEWKVCVVRNTGERTETRHGMDLGVRTVLMACSWEGVDQIVIERVPYLSDVELVNNLEEPPRTAEQLHRMCDRWWSLLESDEEDNETLHHGEDAIMGAFIRAIACGHLGRRERVELANRIRDIGETTYTRWYA